MKHNKPIFIILIIFIALIAGSLSFLVISNFMQNSDTALSEIPEYSKEQIEKLYAQDYDVFINDTDEVTDVLANIEEHYIRPDLDAVSKKDAKKIFSDMTDQAEVWKTNGTITDYRINDNNITVDLANGWPVMYVLDIYELRGTAGSVQTWEPCYDSDSNFSKAQKTYGSTDGAAAQIENTDYLYPFTVNNNELSCTLENIISSWTPYSVILWSGHGCLDAKLGSVLTTGSEMSREEYENCRDNLYSGLVSITGRYKDTRIGITSQFIDTAFEDNALTGSVFFLGSCYSLADDRLADALIIKGADTVIGATTSLQIIAIARELQQFTDCLCARNYPPAKEAYAKSVSWENFGDFLVDVSESMDHITKFGTSARFKMKGQGSFRLNATDISRCYVRDKDTHAGIPNAKISVVGMDKSVVTDNYGVAVVEDIFLPSHYRFYIEAEGYVPTIAECTLWPSTDLVNIYLDPASASDTDPAASADNADDSEMASPGGQTADPNAQSSDPFKMYLEQVLIPQYGVIPTDILESYAQYADFPPAELTGMLSATIKDFDRDGYDEMLIVIFNTDTNTDTNAETDLILQMYEYAADADTVSLCAEISLDTPDGYAGKTNLGLRQIGIFDYEYNDATYIAIDTSFIANESISSLAVFTYIGVNSEYTQPGAQKPDFGTGTPTQFAYYGGAGYQQQGSGLWIVFEGVPSWEGQSSVQPQKPLYCASWTDEWHELCKYDPASPENGGSLISAAQAQDFMNTYNAKVTSLGLNANDVRLASQPPPLTNERYQSEHTTTPQIYTAVQGEIDWIAGMYTYNRTFAVRPFELLREDNQHTLDAFR